MFEIINEDKKQIFISLHLEEIYTEMCLKTHLKDQKRLFSKETLSKKCIDDLVQLNFNKKKYSQYECFIDFSHIKHIVSNSKDKLLQWIYNLPNVKIIHGEECDALSNAIEKCKENACGYREMFNDYGKKYVVKNCCDPKGYKTQIGICLDVYVDIKKIINDSTEMLRWCYIIAYDLNKYFLSVNEDKDKKKLFFCHTLNGAYIAGILSQLLGYDLVYVDHLGPYNKLNKVDFYKGKSRTEEFIVVADLVCLGNEFLRAKNIVEYLGGTVKGCVGIIQMNTSIFNLLPEDWVYAFALKYTTQSAHDELGYSVRTDFCSVQCEQCKKGGTINNGIS